MIFFSYFSQRHIIYIYKLSATFQRQIKQKKNPFLRFTSYYRVFQSHKHAYTTTRARAQSSQTASEKQWVREIRFKVVQFFFFVFFFLLADYVNSRYGGANCSCPKKFSLDSIKKCGRWYIYIYVGNGGGGSITREWTGCRGPQYTPRTVFTAQRSR